VSVIFKPPGSNLLDSKAQAWINPVNCAGAMGKGLALIFKERFPENLRIYQKACSRRELLPGHFLAVATGSEGPAYIVNLATKDHWRDPSRLDWVARGAERVRIWAEGKGIQSVACPALGSGLGGLEWEEVKCALTVAFDDSRVLFEVHEPHEAHKKTFRATPSSPHDSAELPQTTPIQPAVEQPARRIVFRKTPRP
jgi:O-acetyl-ADP-ribose deacetylase (regulator of RNase III)